MLDKAKKHILQVEQEAESAVFNLLGVPFAFWADL